MNSKQQEQEQEQQQEHEQEQEQQQEISTLRHSVSVSAVAFSPDGSRILTSSFRDAIIWNIYNGEIIHKLSGHSGWVREVAWSPSGKMILTGSWDGTARIWRSDTDTLFVTLTGHHVNGHAHWVNGVAWSLGGDGAHVATASEDKTAKIWDSVTGEPLQTTQKHSGVVYAVTFSPNGKFIATASLDTTARIFQVNHSAQAAASAEDTKPLKTLRGHSYAVHAVAWSPTGRLIATGSLDKTVKLWEASSTKTGDSVRTLTGHSEAVDGVAWSPTTDDFVLSSSRDHTTRIWSASTGTILKIFTCHNGWVHAVAWSPLGNCIATASDDKTSKIIPIALPIHHASENSKPPPKSSSSSSRHHAPFDVFHSSERPPSRCFKRVSEQLPFRDALTKLLQLRVLPKGRPDLKNQIPDDDDIKTMLNEVDIKYEKILRDRPKANTLIHDHGLSEDEVKAIICYTMNHPYKAYQWLNAWLMSDRRDVVVVDHVGPFFILLYRAMEKLPRTKVQASRGVLVRNIEALSNTYHDHKERCKKGSPMSFWGIASFSTVDDISIDFMGNPNDYAILYTCGDLECVSIQDLSDYPEENEVLPLPPAIFEVNSATKIGKKLIISMNQKDHHDIAYVEPQQQQTTTTNIVMV